MESEPVRESSRETFTAKDKVEFADALGIAVPSDFRNHATRQDIRELIRKLHNANANDEAQIVSDFVTREVNAARLDGQIVELQYWHLQNHPDVHMRCNGHNCFYMQREGELSVRIAALEKGETK